MWYTWYRGIIGNFILAATAATMPVAVASTVAPTAMVAAASTTAPAAAAASTVATATTKQGGIRRLAK
jgi:hypothetical protein